MAEMSYIMPLTTGRYWFTSPEYPDPQVLWYSAESRTVLIIGTEVPRPIDPSIKIIGPCQFITVKVNHKLDSKNAWSVASPVDAPVFQTRPPVGYYEIEIEVDKEKVHFVSAAKTYEKRHDFEESAEFEIGTTASGVVTIYQLGRSRMTKRTPSNDVGEFGLGERGGPGQLS
jgi:hypothetical protein